MDPDSASSKCSRYKRNQGHFITGVALVIFLGALCKITTGDKVQLEGWTEVKKTWPLEEKDYFLATEKGHHFIEVQGLPRELNSDLLVTLHYYYSYDRVKPVVQMTPCATNIYLHNETSKDRNREWLEHKQLVRRDDCTRRNELAFNVLLHDKSDLFAWRLMAIEPVKEKTPSPESIGTDPTKTKENEKAEAVTKDDSTATTTVIDVQNNPPTSPDEVSGPPKEDTGVLDHQNISLEPKEAEQTKANVEANANMETKAQINTSGGSEDATGDSNKVETENSEDQHENEASKREGAAKYEVKEQEDISTESKKEVQSDPPANLENKSPTDSSPKLPIPKESDTLGGVVKEKTDKDIGGSDKNTPRRRRFAIDESEFQPNTSERHIEDLVNDLFDRSEENTNEAPKIACKPSSCDRNLFHMARFLPLVNGVPKQPEGSTGKFYLNTKDQPLKVNMILEEEHVSSVDSCFNLTLYMDKGTELELLLDESMSSKAAESYNKTEQSSKQRLLEHIARKESDSTAGRWEQFNRCLGDYMPQYDPAVGNGLAPLENDNQIKLLLKPGKTNPSKQIGLLSTDKAFYTRRLYPTKSFAPNIRHMSDEREIENYWIMDRDGIRKPIVKLIADTSSNVSTATKRRQTKRMLITGIDASQEYFDITSRWLQIKDIELVEQPILFEYRAQENEWVDRILFQFQRAGDPLDKWIEQVAYEAPQQKRAQVSSTSTSDGAGSSQRSNGSTVDIPIRLKGLDMDQFRVRLRHKLKHLEAAQASGSNMDKSLLIESLAFADACSYRVREYCQNGGECYPTGPATAECRCLPGFLGPFCEFIKPCEVIYANGTLTGYDLCRSAGASCVENLPVLRCQWPNDQYYHCRPLFNPSTSNQSNSSNIRSPHNGDETLPPPVVNIPNPNEPLESLSPPEQAARLQAMVNQQAKLVIILAVFLIAIVIFSVVLIGSMVGRLRKSKLRLERSQSETHELARRVSPSTSSSVMFGAPPVSGASLHAPRSVSGPPKVTSYNNSAFDVE